MTPKFFVRSELPGIEVSNNVSAEFGDNIVLTCNFTISQAASKRTKLTKLMWAKDGRLIEEVLYPKGQSLKSLKVYVDRPEVGGIYSCHLTSKLRNVKEYNVTGSIYVSVQPRFFPERKKEKKMNRLVCTAQGNPLVTEWKRKNLHNDDIWVLDTKDNSSKGKYVFSNMDGFKDHTLTIYDVQPKDAGQYYCCIKNITSPRPPEDISNCQIFDVQPPGSVVGKASLTFSIILLDLLLNWLL
ncbi:uncharacterized protein LOC116309081 [Actinia tenebrosa]|uniref:Uncharacterized protein LOC116309081 n=1 Tax=Actinia tenebrosa TaxID=6105 RepID=A0A6P8JGZ4_ACTTE|nr:uncharacterized protein LOC116309081 [Actinia tenebrosa]